MGVPAIILDRDGVVNENRPDHVKSWDEFRFLNGTLKALQQLSLLGVPIVVVTNQAIVGRGVVPQAVVDDIHERMVTAVHMAGARIDQVFCCPHDRDDGCECRKPMPGMLHAAASSLGIDLERSVLVGDALTDVAAGKSVNCKTVLVLTGRGQDALRTLSQNLHSVPNAIERNLLHALPTITSFLGSEAPLPAGSYR